uniref:Inhibitor of growth protein n=1 Tax=Aceria tosichella TaxID=561515 RepID=A0A6G1SM87_9ACAR
MLYLEDYLELIEHLPQELRDRFTLIRESDLHVNNSSLHIDTKVKQFFAEAEKLNPEQRQCEYENILKDFEKTLEYADDKVQLADQTHDIMVKLIQKLDGEIDKFKLELEADHAGISLGNNLGFKSTYKNHYSSPYDQQHSALKAALSSRVTPTPQDIVPVGTINSSSIQNNKISTNYNSVREKGSNHTDANNPFVRQNPLAAAASQAIAATQQLHQGRRTSSLKASFAAINAAGLGGNYLDSLGYNNKEGLNRNALAPMAPGQQAFRYSQHYGRLSANGNSSPSYLPVTKSGRSTKRPKHHASHIYPDESPPSISSDNSVFEYSESMSSADFIDGGTAFGSTSPSSFDCTNSSRISDQNGAGTFYQRDETKYCICRQISYGAMVACDNEECEIEWFHYDCVGITQPPKGKWYCFECTKKMSSLDHHNTSSHQQTQTHRKRGRKEMIAN